jgi:nuclear transport factor 2 (NTF2) superfamily protein
MALGCMKNESEAEMVIPGIVPPFTEESALAKVQMAEDLWNTRDPERVVLAYTEDSEWRNRTEFLKGREELRAFLRRKWAKELDYRLKKTLWGFRQNRMAVTFEYEWHDATGQWYRSYGVELWEFNEEGLMQRREASINDAPIKKSERRVVFSGSEKNEVGP